MNIESVQIAEVEQIAGAQRVDCGRELRDRIAGVLLCSPESLHPDRERRADA
jgi:hypothetical protein